MVDFITKIIIPLLCAIITVYIIPWLKDKKIYSAVKIAVQAAEQIFNETGKGKEKFAYVQGWAMNKFKITEDDLEKFIESAVYELNRKKKKKE